MHKLEENDLLILIQSLRASEYKSFRKQLQVSTHKSAESQLNLLHQIKRQKMMDKDKFVAKFNLNQKTFSHLKLQLFGSLLKHKVDHAKQYSATSLNHELSECLVLLDNGLFTKANRKLKKIKRIAFETSNFNICALAQNYSISCRLVQHLGEDVTEAYQVLKEYQRLQTNLDTYLQLLYEVLNLHYDVLDKRSKNRQLLLEFLNNDLLQDETLPASVITKYQFYNIKALIFLGVNNFEESKKHALKAYEFLVANSSEYRDDFLRSFFALNNYLDASLNLQETEAYEEMYPKLKEMDDIVSKEKNKLTVANIFQMMCSLRLNYLWLKQDFTKFKNEYQKFKQDFNTYQSFSKDNFKLEILLGFARMFFIGNDLEKADYYCVLIADEKSNPTSLYVSCGCLLRIMVNIDMGHYQLIPHLVNNVKYTLKKRGRLFEFERCFLNGLNKVKSYYFDSQRLHLFKDLHSKMEVLLTNSEEKIVDQKIGILNWLASKSK